MKAIACVDRFLGIGYKGQLLFHLKEDLKRFKELTTHKTLVMGYNTYRSLPNGALSQRTNVVLTKHHRVKDPRVITVKSEKELNEYLSSRNIPTDDVWLIGGEQLYKQFLQKCDELYLTIVDDVKKADSYFPDLVGWKVTSSYEFEERNTRFTMQTLRQQKVTASGGN